MKKMVILERKFMFDPSVSYSRVSEFDNMLARFLDSINVEAERIDVVGQEWNDILYLKPKSNLAVPTAPRQQGRPITIQGKVNQLRSHKINAKERDFKKGKLLSRKGYLKK